MPTSPWCWSGHAKRHTTTMTDELNEIPYGTLMNVARSANEQFSDIDIDTHAPTKDELVEAMADANINQDDDEWFVDDEEIDLLPVQTPDNDGSSAGPRDKTVLYCLTRAETTPSRVGEIARALEEETDFVLVDAADGKYKVILPAENDPEQAHFFEETDEEAAESDESDSSEEDDADIGDNDETEESAEESDESDEDDERTDVERLVADHDKDELYEAAVEHDIVGRSEMTKAELANALVNAGVTEIPVAPAA